MIDDLLVHLTSIHGVNEHIERLPLLRALDESLNQGEVEDLLHVVYVVPHRVYHFDDKGLAFHLRTITVK